MLFAFERHGRVASFIDMFVLELNSYLIYTLMITYIKHKNIKNIECTDSMWQIRISEIWFWNMACVSHKLAQLNVSLLFPFFKWPQFIS